MPTAPEKPAAKRRLSWCCVYCNRNYRTTTRVGKHSTCPHCKAQNPGPTTVLQMMEQLGRVMRGERRRKPASEPVFIESPSDDEPPAATNPPVSDETPAAPPPPPRRKGLGALLSGEWQG